MAKKFYKIEDFIDTTSAAFELSGRSPLDNHNYTMASSASVLTDIEQNFAERSIYVPETNTPMASFAALWSAWRARRGDMIAAAYQVLHSEYEPLENYYRQESGTDKKKFTHGEKIQTTPEEGTVTTTPGATETITHTPSEVTNTITPAETTNTLTPAETTNTASPAETTSTKTPTVTRTHSEDLYAFNSSAAVPVSKGDNVEVSGTETDAITVQTAGSDAVTVQTPGSEAVTVQTPGSEAVTVQTAGSDVKSYTGYDEVKTAYTKDRTEQHSGTDLEEFTRGGLIRGNIGVTSSQDMVLQELGLREKDLIYSAICEFINLYTVYA